MAVMIALVGALVLFALTVGERERKAEMRNVLFANAALAPRDLRACLAPGLAPGLAAQDLQVVVKPHGKGARLELSSRGGRPLDKVEAEALRRCLAAG